MFIFVADTIQTTAFGIIKLQIEQCKDSGFKLWCFVVCIVLKSRILQVNAWMFKLIGQSKKCRLSVQNKVQTHGCSDWPRVHLARKTADAAILEGRNCKKLYSTSVSSAK